MSNAHGYYLRSNPSNALDHGKLRVFRRRRRTSKDSAAAPPSDSVSVMQEDDDLGSLYLEPEPDDAVNESPPHLGRKHIGKNRETNPSNFSVVLIVAISFFALIGLYFTYERNTLKKYRWIVLPSLVGPLVTLVTAFVIYFDSHIPGVVPPSPKVSKVKCFRMFHLPYAMALANGIVAAVYFMLVN